MSKVTKKQLQREIQRQERRIDNLVRRLAENGFYDKESEPQPKQLDQSVFDGLDEKWRFAAVDDDGSAYAFIRKPEIDECEVCFIVDDAAGCKWISGAYDASNWQNSLIERDTDKELLEVDLSSELTGSDLALELLKNQRYIVASVSDISDADAIECGNNKLIHKSSEDIFTDDMGGIYCWAVALNNQGEPLTAAEAGL